MKSVLTELCRLPEFVRWRNPVLVLLLIFREILRPFVYWYLFDVFETDLRSLAAEPYSKQNFDIMIYRGNEGLKEVVESLTALDDLLPADIELRLKRGDAVAVCYTANEVAGCMWLTFSKGMEVAFGTSWMIDSTEALRYGTFIRPQWRGRRMHGLLANALNRYARERGMVRTVGGISVLNSQSRRLYRRCRNIQTMRIFLFRVRGLKWTYRKAIGAPLESRFAIEPWFQSRSARPQQFYVRRLRKNVAH